MHSKQRYLGLAIITIAVAAQANADTGNPLHPSFYWGTAAAVAAATSGTTPYVDSRNPLHPTYARSTVDWQPALTSTGAPYIDSNNPLHPSFKR